jgi:hypothetical protein
MEDKVSSLPYLQIFAWNSRKPSAEGRSLGLLQSAPNCPESKRIASLSWALIFSPMKY